MLNEPDGQSGPNNIVLEKLARDINPRKDMDGFSFKTDIISHKTDILKYFSLVRMLLFVQIL